MSTLYYRLRIRDATDTADVVVISSVRGGTNPYLSAAPSGDGATFDPLTTDSVLGAYVVRIADWPIGSMQRVFTAQLEDANFRQQLGFRKAFVEWSADGTTWSGGTNGGTVIGGVVSLVRLVSAAEWEVTVSDPMAAQAVTALFAPTSGTAIMDFLTTWPYRGCILGGPIMTPKVSGKLAKILGITDLGGWTMSVETSGIANQYFLRPISVYGPPDWKAAPTISEELATTINQAVAQLQNSANDGSASAWTTIDDTQQHYYCWPGLVVLVDSGGGFQPFKPLPYEYASLADANGNLNSIPLVSPVKGSSGTGLHIQSDGTRTLTNGAIVRVRVLTILPSEIAPLYLEANPVDLLTTFWTAAGLAYDASACAALKSTMAGFQMALRITAPKQLADLVQAVCAPFGLGVRSNDAGQLQPFQGRALPNTPPTLTITAAEVVDGSTQLVFELDPAQAIKTITLSQKIFADQRNVPYGDKHSIVDGVVPVDDTITLINGDAAAIPFGQFDLATDGQLLFSNAQTPTLASFGTAIAQTLFDRFGHGPIALETTLRRGGAGDRVALGTEVLVNLPQLPNHNYRLGDNPAVSARAMQCVRRTVTPSGYEVRLLDSGPNAQPLPTLPTLTIAASSDAPRTVAVVTITNAATLNAAHYGARLQWAMTTDGSAPASSQYVDVAAWGGGQVPSTVRLPAAAAGATVDVQARSEPGTGNARPSNYSTPTGLTLSALADPTGVTATPSGTDGSLCALAWTPGSGTALDYVDVFVRNGGTTFDTAVKQRVLSPGSTRYTLEGLTPGAAYIASVQYRDPTTQGLSDAVDVSFTAGATTFTLPAPVNQNGFCGALTAAGLPQRDGSYGIGVLAADYPGYVELAVAIETAIGSGTYGSFTTIGAAPSVAGNWTVVSDVAPNDGRRRQLKARHVRTGCTASAYTPVVTVLPWTPTALPPYASNTAVVCEVTVLAPSPSSDAGVNLRFEVTGIDPSGGTPTVQLQSLGTGVSIVSGPAVGVASPNNQVWKVALPAPGSGPSSLVVRAVSGATYGEATIALPEQTTLASPQGTVSVDANGQWSFTCDGPANAQSFRYGTLTGGVTSGYPSDTTTAASGAIITGGRTASVNGGGTLSFGQTLWVTIIPFTGPSGSGTPLPSIHIRGSYLSFSTSKYDTYPGAAFVVTAASVTADPSTGKLVGAFGANPIKPQAVLNPRMSSGLTISSLSLYGLLTFSGSGTERLVADLAYLTKATQTFNAIAQAETDSSSGAVQLVTQAGSHTVDTNANTYLVRALLADSSATASALELWSVTVGYTQNNPSQGL